MYIIICVLSEPDKFKLNNNFVTFVFCLQVNEWCSRIRKEDHQLDRQIRSE